MTTAEDLGIQDFDDVEALDVQGSAIFRARQFRHNRDVAIKILQPHQEPLVPRRFDLRRKALQRFADDGGVVPIYSFGSTVGGEPYLVMPYFRMGSLADQLDHGPMPWHRAAELVVRTAEIVDRGPDLGVVLGDLKPSSILLADASSPIVSVYGMATRRFENGSPTYAAPEAATGAGPTPASDVYSLCLTLAALIAGRPPGPGPLPVEFMAEVASLAPARIVEVIARGLAQSPRARHRDAAELAGSLASAIAGDHPPAPRPADEPFDLETLIGPPRTGGNHRGDTGNTGNTGSTGDTGNDAASRLDLDSVLEHPTVSTAEPTGFDPGSFFRRRRPVPAIEDIASATVGPSELAPQLPPEIGLDDLDDLPPPGTDDAALPRIDRDRSPPPPRAEDAIHVLEPVEPDDPAGGDEEAPLPDVSVPDPPLDPDDTAPLPERIPERAPSIDSVDPAPLAGSTMTVGTDVHPARSRTADDRSSPAPAGMPLIGGLPRPETVANDRSDEVGVLDAAEPPTAPHGPVRTITADEELPFRSFDRQQVTASPPSPLHRLLDPLQAAWFQVRRSLGGLLAVLGFAAIAGVVALLLVRDLRAAGTGAGPSSTFSTVLEAGSPTTFVPTSEAPVFTEPPATHDATTADRVVRTTTAAAATRARRTTAAPTTKAPTTATPVTASTTTATTTTATSAPTTTEAPSATTLPSTTEEPDGSPTEPLIERASASRIRATSARIRVSSPVCVTSSFTYGSQGEETRTVTSGGQCSKTHTLLLGIVTPRLQPATTYAVLVTATDGAGRSATRQLSFTTLG